MHPAPLSFTQVITFEHDIALKNHSASTSPKKGIKQKSRKAAEKGARHLFVEGNQNHRYFLLLDLPSVYVHRWLSLGKVVWPESS